MIEEDIDAFPERASDGRTYYDFTRLLSDKDGFEAAMKGFKGMFDREVFDAFVSTESYAGMFAGALSQMLGKPLIPVKYEGGFPGTVVSEACPKTSGCTRVEMRPRCIAPGTRVVIMADVLATGKTTSSMIRLIESQGGTVVRIGYIAELADHGARKNKVLKGYPFECLATY